MSINDNDTMIQQSRTIPSFVKSLMGKHSICMVSDFFYPRLGGVEMHMWSLAQCLLALGHKVVVVTNQYGERAGVRYMTHGLKVYYMPLIPFADQDSFPTFLVFYPYFRQIVLRECITVVHGHQVTSTMSHECLLAARTMGIPAVYTDHSLYSFHDMTSINANKLMKFTMSDVDHAICVSHTCRENLVLRAHMDPRRTSAIPNAVDTTRFKPDPSSRWPRETINIVMVSRLVYRKGIDLVVTVIPEICRRFPEVHFIIGGDGPKKIILEEMRERHQLHDRVELLGAVPHSNVRDTLVRGHIFLNCSLTESFCIAILEAACAGLFVVSTRVGGVPEVLPPNMISFADPDPMDLIAALSEAIPHARDIDPYLFHKQVESIYSWHDVAKRTVKVYDKISNAPATPLIERLRRAYGTGRVFGIVSVLIVVAVHVIFTVIEMIWPRDTIEIAPNFPRDDYLAQYDPMHIQQEFARLHNRPEPSQQPYSPTVSFVSSSQHSDMGSAESGVNKDTIHPTRVHRTTDTPAIRQYAAMAQIAPAPFDQYSGTPYAPPQLVGTGRVRRRHRRKRTHRHMRLFSEWLREKYLMQQSFRSPTMDGNEITPATPLPTSHGTGTGGPSGMLDILDRSIRSRQGGNHSLYRQRSMSDPGRDGLQEMLSALQSALQDATGLTAHTRQTHTTTHAMRSKTSFHDTESPQTRTNAELANINTRMLTEFSNLGLSVIGEESQIGGGSIQSIQGTPFATMSDSLENMNSHGLYRERSHTAHALPQTEYEDSTDAWMLDLPPMDNVTTPQTAYAVLEKQQPHKIFNQQELTRQQHHTDDVTYTNSTTTSTTTQQYNTDTVTRTKNVSTKQHNESTDVTHTQGISNKQHHASTDVTHTQGTSNKQHHASTDVTHTKDASSKQHHASTDVTHTKDASIKNDIMSTISSSDTSQYDSSSAPITISSHASLQGDDTSASDMTHAVPSTTYHPVDNNASYSFVCGSVASHQVPINVTSSALAQALRLPFATTTQSSMVSSNVHQGISTTSDGMTSESLSPEEIQTVESGTVVTSVNSTAQEQYTTTTEDRRGRAATAPISNVSPVWPELSPRNQPYQDLSKGDTNVEQNSAASARPPRASRRTLVTTPQRSSYIRPSSSARAIRRASNPLISRSENPTVSETIDDTFIYSRLRSPEIMSGRNSLRSVGSGISYVHAKHLQPFAFDIQSTTSSSSPDDSSSEQHSDQTGSQLVAPPSMYAPSGLDAYFPGQDSSTAFSRNAHASADSISLGSSYNVYSNIVRRNERERIRSARRAAEQVQSSASVMSPHGSTYTVGRYNAVQKSRTSGFRRNSHSDARNRAHSIGGTISSTRGLPEAWRQSSTHVSDNIEVSDDHSVSTLFARNAEDHSEVWDDADTSIAVIAPTGPSLGQPSSASDDQFGRTSPEHSITDTLDHSMMSVDQTNERDYSQFESPSASLRHYPRLPRSRSSSSHSSR